MQRNLKIIVKDNVLEKWQAEKDAMIVLKASKSLWNKKKLEIKKFNMIAS